MCSLLLFEHEQPIAQSKSEQMLRSVELITEYDVKAKGKQQANRNRRAGKHG